MPKPTQAEINKQLNKANDAIEAGESNWPGMTYEEGVAAAIRWMIGDEDTPPMDDE